MARSIPNNSAAFGPLIQKVQYLEQDKEWLAAQLAGGPKESEQIIENGRAVGISRNRLFRAKESLGAGARKNGFEADVKWEWFLDS